MWVLSVTSRPTEAGKAGAHYYLTVGKHGVGRKGAVPVSDKSVSRAHAYLLVTHNEQRPRVSIIDRSRFGTLRNGNKLAPGKQTELAEGDELKFGVNQDVYRLSFEPLVMYWCADDGDGTAFSREERGGIQKALHTLGGHVTEDPDRATISMMKEICVSYASLQLLQSIVRGLPIVTPAFLQAILDRPLLSTPLPSATDYIPPLAKNMNEEAKKAAKMIQKGLQDGPPPLERAADLFIGMTFVFLSRRQFGLSQIVAEMGGEVVELSKQNEKRFYHQHRQSCVISPQGQERDPLVEKHIEMFRSLGIELIDPLEIVLAIIYRDVSAYCNPRTPASPDTARDVRNVTERMSAHEQWVEESQSEEATFLPDINVMLGDEHKADQSAHDEIIPQGSITPQQKKRKISAATPVGTNLQAEIKKRRISSAEIETSSQAESDQQSREGRDETAEPNRQSAKEVPVTEPLMVTAYKRLLVRTPQSGIANFKRFKKGGSRQMGASRERTQRVIACEEDDGKPSSEMAAWLKESTEDENEATKFNKAADELWDVKPRNFPMRSSSSTPKAAQQGITFSLSRHTRSASTSEASTTAPKKPTTRRKTTFV